MKHHIPFASAILLLFLAGCVSSDSVTMEKIVEEGDTVALHYTGTLVDGSQFDSSVGREPLSFVIGAGQVIKGFNDGALALKEGEKKTIVIEPVDGYGEYVDSLVLPVEIAKLPEGAKVGDSVSANSRTAVIKSIDGDSAQLDFNHELAGKQLTFVIEIVSITKP